MGDFIIQAVMLIGLLWGLPMAIAFAVGRSVGRRDAAPKDGQRTLIQAISQLDRLHATGKLDTDHYRAARQPLFEEARASGLLPPAPTRPPAPGIALGEVRSVEPPATQPAFARSTATPSDETSEVPVDVVIEAQLVEPEAVEADSATGAASHSPPTTPVYVPPRRPQSGDTTSLRGAEPSTKPAPWDVPDEPSAPRRTWGELLQAFMEDKNIRWGELLSGILIVGSAIGLVLSLRDQLEQTIPYFPSMLFMALAATVHAAGIYTYRRWKLETTSRGVLVIGMVLVPLGFMAACLLSSRDETRAVTDPLYLTAVAVGLAGYGTMSLASSRILLPGRWLSLGLGVLGASALMLAANRLADGPAPALGLSLGLAAVSVAGAAGLHVAWGRSRLWSDRDAGHFSMALALTGVAALVTLGLLTYRIGATWTAARSISPAYSLGAAWLAVAGVMIQTRSGAVRWKLTGVSLGLSSLVLLAATQVVAWPAPHTVMAAGALATGALLAGGVALGSPLLAGAAVAVAAPAWLVATQWALGNYPAAPVLWQDHRALVAASSGISLTLLLAVVEGLGFWRLRRGDAAVGGTLMAGGGVLAVGSVALTVVASVLTGEAVDAHLATALLGVYGLAAVLASWKVQHREIGLGLSAGGAVLLLGACVRATTGPAALSIPGLLGGWLDGLALHAVLMAALAGCAAWVHRRAEEDTARRHAQLMIRWSLASAAAAVALQYPFAPTYSQQAILWWLVTMVCFAAAGLHRSSHDYAAAELLGAVAVGLTATAVLQSRQFSWQHVLDGQLFHVLLASLTLWAGALTWAERTRRPRWLRELTRDSVVGPLLIGLVTLACGHVVLAGVPLWQTDLYGEGYPWSWAQRATPWAIGTLIGLGAIVLWRAARRPTALRVEAAGLLVTALVLRLSLLASPPVLASCWAAATLALVVAVALGHRVALHRGWRRLDAASLDNSPPRLSLSAMASVMAPATVLIVVLSWLSLWAPGPAATPSLAWLNDATAAQLTSLLPLPLLAVAWMIVAYNLRLEPAALTGGVVLAMGAAIWQLGLPESTRWSNADLVRVVQWQLLAAAGWGLIWLPLRGRMKTRHPQPAWGVQFGWTLVLPLVLAVWAVVEIFWRPGELLDATTAIGTPASYLGLAAAAALAVLYLGRREPRLMGAVWGGAGLCLSGLVAASLDAVDAQRQWWAYHAVMAGATISVVAIAAAASLPERRREQLGVRGALADDSLAGSAWLLGGVALLMAWRGFLGDPSGAVWPATISLVLAAASGVLAVSSGQALMAPAGNILVGSAALFISYHATPHPLLWALDVGAAMLAHAAIWAVIDRLAHSGVLSWRGERRSRFHWQWALAGSALLSVPVALQLLSPRDPLLVWHLGAAITAQLFLCVACLWDVRVSRQTGPLFLTGVWASLAAVASIYGAAEERYAAAGLALAAYLVVVTAIWRRRTAWDWRLSRLGSPGATDSHEGLAGYGAASRWLPPTLLAGSLALTVCALPGVLGGSERWMRFALAAVPLLGAAAVGGSALSATNVPRRRTSVLLAVIGCVWISWADIGVGGAGAWLERLVRGLTMTAAAAGVLGVAGPRWRRGGEAWTAAFRSGFLGSLAAFVGLFAVLLALEAATFHPVDGAPLSTMQALSVAAFVAALVLALIAVAVFPARDPLQLSDRARVAYSYGAQALGGLLVLHLFLSMPELFREQWRPYWPYIVMAIAMIGAAAGEVLQRSGQKVLGDPLVRTSLLLPLVPLLGMTVAASQGSYGHVAALAAVLMAAAAFSGRSWICGAAAVLLGNIALWAYYRETGWLTLARNPQAWLIPPALSVLIAAQLYRRKLKDSQLAFIRYIAISMIYISSASEMFLQGIGETLWPPMVLAVLSVLGVLAGILIRVRAFLYFGSGFLLMSMVAMVSHAGRAFDHVWPWWALGITMGAAILTLFGVFEKRRDDMRLLLDQLRRWDA